MQDNQNFNQENLVPLGAEDHSPSWKKVAAALMGGALFSKGLGFFREVFMAHVIGVAQMADSFRASITAFLLPLAFVQNESVPAILVPMIREGKSRDDAAQRVAALSIVMVAIGVLVMICTELFGRFYIGLFVSGFSEEGKELTWMFFRVLALGMPASVLLNCLVAAEITLSKTRIATLRASVINVGILAGLVIFYKFEYASALAWSYMVLLNFLAIFGVNRLMKEGYLLFDGCSTKLVISIAREFLKRLRPFLMLPLAEQSNTWLERLLASQLIIGAIASIDYARTLTDSSMLLISHPIGWAIMAGAAHRRNQTEQAISITKLVLATIVPASVFLFIFSTDIVRLIFYRGAFGDHGLAMTSHALSGISIGLWASTLGWILLRFLNNIGRNKTTVVILLSSFVANFLFNYSTQSLPSSADDGVFLLGAGEAVRSGVLLLGCVLFLEYRARIVHAMLKAIIPAVAMGVIGYCIHQYIDTSILRLAVGVLGYGVAVLLGVLILSPELFLRLPRLLNIATFRKGN
jgi:putative peptidoglycan lipid II flippase